MMTTMRVRNKMKKCMLIIVAIVIVRIIVFSVLTWDENGV